MTIAQARGIAAQAWCHPTTSHLVMEGDLAEQFAQTLMKFDDAAEYLWGVVANVSGGDWTLQTPEWQQAAARARDAYHALFALMPKDDTDDAPAPTVTPC